MAQKDPITSPPLELVEKWRREWLDKPEIRPNRDIWITSQAAQWAAEQQSETCLKWLEDRMAVPPEELEGIMSSFRATLTQSPPKSMTHPHPITPPPELVEELQDLGNLDAIQLAYQAGADHELEACCKWLFKYQYDIAVVSLRNARRPKPPSLKEQALEQLRVLDQHGALACNTDKIRRALEALPND